MKRFWAFYGVLPTVLMVCLLSFGMAAPSAAAPGLHDLETVSFYIPEDAPDPNQTFDLVNEVRVSHGLNILKADSRLGEVARARALDMFARQYYAHKNPDGKYYYDSFSKFDIKAGYSCENLDLVFVPSQEQVIDEWMNSMRGHKHCMLSANVTHAGYATTKLTLVNLDQTETTAYLVVAIHAFIE